MKRITLAIMALAMSASSMLQAKTLVVYYSFTSNCRTIAQDLKGQLADADLMEVQPAEEGLDYAANGYEIGSALISAIRNHPNDASSYPAIKPMTVDFAQYDDIVVATPLWWSNMAAPMQTFLFQNGSKMAGKKIGLIVSSASSGISSVESDAKRLIPDGDFAQSLWIRSSQVGNCHSMIASWLASTGIGTSSSTGIASVDMGSYGTGFGADADANVSVYDASGKLVLTTVGKDVKNIGSLAPNVYVARIKKGNASSSYKFVVK